MAGKDLNSIKESQESRAELIQRFENKIPESIMVHNRQVRAIVLTAERRWEAVKANMKEKLSKHMTREEFEDIADKESYMEGLKSGFAGSRGTGKDVKALSRFSQNICRMVIKFYTEEGDIIVDPFAGHNSRFESAFRTGRHYYGQDLTHEFMVDNLKVREMLLQEVESKPFLKKKPTIIDLTEGDSRHLPWPDNFGDFTITSPPYWFLEYYGNEKEQLGYGENQTYQQFLDGMQLVANENFRVLKPGAFCVWFINDFQYDGKFYDYHGDTKKLLENAGFEYWDMIIADLGQSLRSIFLTNCFKSKRLPKRHEYGVVMRKPK